MIRQILKNALVIKKDEEVSVFKKLFLICFSLFFFTIFVTIVGVINQFVIEVQKFFSVPGNVAITIIGISIFIGLLLATKWKVKKTAEQTRKAQYEELMRLEEEDRIRNEKEAEEIRVEKAKEVEKYRIERENEARNIQIEKETKITPIKKDKETERLQISEQQKSELMGIAKEEFSPINAEKERVLKDIVKVDDILNNFSKILDDYLIIDSNIWMENIYENFFQVLSDVCYYYKLKICIHGVQFDEIVNIKNKYSYDNLKSKKARCAIGRIERLQKENVLDIKPISVNAKRKAYADPVLIKLLLEQAKNGVKTTLISNDKELCIRARQLLKDMSAQNWAILDFENLLNDCNFYVKTMSYNIDVKNFNPEIASELPN